MDYQTIIVAVISSGALTALITSLLNRHYQRKIADSQMLDSVTGGAERISKSALEQLNFLSEENKELRADIEKAEAEIEQLKIEIAKLQEENRKLRALVNV